MLSGTQLIQLYKFVCTIPKQNININLHSKLPYSRLITKYCAHLHHISVALKRYFPVSLNAPLPNSEQINHPFSKHTYTKSTPNHIHHHYAPFVTLTYTTHIFNFTHNDEPWVIIKEDVGIDYAYCTCMAGLEECCSHVGVVLFAMEESTKARDDTTVTYVPAYCLDPSKATFDVPLRQ